MDLEVKAEEAKNATLTLLSAIRSCQSSYDERIMEPLNNFLSTTYAFKDAFELLQATSPNPKTLQQIESEIALIEEEIQNVIEAQFQKLQDVDSQIKQVQRRFALLESLQQVGDAGKWLAFGQRIAVTSAPPVNWKIGEPLGACKPPYPTEDMLRASLLFSSASQAATSHPTQEVQSRTDHKTEFSEHKKASKISDSEYLLDLDLNPDLLD